MGITEHIRDLINSVPEETPFFLSDVVGNVSSEFSIERLAARNIVQQELKKRMDKGALFRCFRGIYCKPRSGTPCPPIFDVDEAVGLYCHDLEGHRIGYRTDFIVPVVDASVENARNAIVTNRYKGGPQPSLAKAFDLTLVVPKTKVDEKNFEYLAILDALSSTPRVKEQLGSVAEQVSDYLEEQGLSFAELLGYASRLYPPDIVLLAASLCDAGMQG